MPGSAATVNSDGIVTFCLSAPQATNVQPNFQNDAGHGRVNAGPMTYGAKGVWAVTIGPLAPNW
jgi:hypothetical protein